MSVVKEPCYFSRDLALDDSGNFLVYGRDEKLYYDLFDDAEQRAKRAGEGSTRYLYSHDAPALIHEASARRVRDRDAAQPGRHDPLAARAQAGRRARRTSPTSRRRSRRKPTETRGARFPSTRTPSSRPIAIARCSPSSCRAGSTRSAATVSTLASSRTWSAIPLAEFRKVLEFLQVDPAWQPESFAAYNTAHGARSMAIRRALNGRVPQWFVWKALPRVIGDTRTRGLVRDFRHSWFHRKKIEKGALRPEMRRQLEDEFMPDVDAAVGDARPRSGRSCGSSVRHSTPAAPRPKQETIAAS